MLPLALVVCPVPADRPAMQLAARWLAELGRDEVVIFCTEPYQAPLAWTRSHRVLPIADLAVERARGAITAPAYLCDGGPGEQPFARAALRVPGRRIDAATAPAPREVQRLVAAAGPVAPVAAAGVTVEAMVLAYRSKDYVAPCLQSLLDQDWPGLKITVLDNASGDGTAEFVRRAFPTVELIESSTNLGFAAGHNLLFARSTADFVLLLNHDAVARRDLVAELVAAAQAHPDGAAFGAKMLMRRCPTILNSTGIVMSEGGFAADRDIGRPDLAPAGDAERVFGVCGGAMLLRGTALRALGGFDPTFFMYVEDVDWCWRARLAGHEIYYVPTATAVHDWHGDMAAAAKAAAPGQPRAPASASAAAELEGRRRAMIERNRLQTVIKNYERGNLRRAWRELSAYDAGRIAALREQVARGGGELPQRVLAALQAGRSWCRWHALGLWLRRRRTQSLRRVADATFTGLIQPGFAEPSGVGDLHAIVDHHCATGRARIAMASADAGSLGPGWHHPEPDGAGGGLRWTMGECWFYLQAERAWSTVQITLVPQPRDTWAELWLDGVRVGREPVARDRAHTLRWTLPDVQPAGRMIAGRLLCGVFVPAREGMGGDTRELGLHVAAIECV